MSLWKLRFRMWIATALLFSLLFAIFSAVGFLAFRGTGFLLFSFALSLAMVLFQFLAGPAMVGWSMKVKYVSESEEPRLHAVVEELARQGNLPKPRVGISEVPIPNAFAFGRWKSDGRICVTRELMNRVDESELRGVLGHELSHLRHRDVAFMTVLQVIPLVFYHIYLYFFWSGMFGGRDRDRNGGGALAVAMMAFVVYFLSNLLVLYANRLRELYADQGSIELTGQRAPLASALYKIAYGSARRKPDELKGVQACRALFMADPATARQDVLDFRSADLNQDGKIDEFELEAFARETGKMGRGDRLMEVFSTHPAMVRRVQILAKS